jgi:hypothetical protein
MGTASKALGYLAVVQGSFYVATGLWPVFNLRTFEAVTGRKRDGWLVKTTGLLIAAVGSAVLLGGRRGRDRAQTAWLGASTAAALGAADIYYVARKRIPRVYLLDAAAELAFVAGWIALGRGALSAYRP